MLNALYVTGPALEIFFVADGAAYVVRQKSLIVPKWSQFPELFGKLLLLFPHITSVCFSFLICLNTTLCPTAKVGPVKACHWFYCGVSVVCSITMEHFKCDPKVVRMALCEVQSLSHVTLIWCEVTTWKPCDPHWLSLLIWSVLSQIFKGMFKGSV